MKNYYLVRPNGEASVISYNEVNSYPFVSDDETHSDMDRYSEDWQQYETFGTEWCIAVAESGEEAAALVDKSANGLKNVENVWCEICGHHHEALAE